MSRSLIFSFCFGIFCLAGTACSPKYPECKRDEHCREAEFCIHGKCQQCRDKSDCKTGEQCNDGRCERADDYCDSINDCPDGTACVDNHCVTCTNDSQCGPQGQCRNGRCIQPGQCNTDADCPPTHECQNGTCIAPPPESGGAGSCLPEPIYFGFDVSVLDTTASSQMQEIAQCIKKNPTRRIRIEGHCDPRGTEEYNLALGDRRARSVSSYLSRLGVNSTRMRIVSKGKLEATGVEESSWARDRKVVFTWE